MAAGDLYDELTEGFTRPVRLEELVYRAAGRLPWQLPTREQMDAERGRPLAEKRGIELGQGAFLAEILDDPRAGRHLLESMLRPTPEARARLEELRERGVVDLGPVRVTRHGKAAVLELRNPRHLNAEDGTTLGATESRGRPHPARSRDRDRGAPRRRDRRQGATPAAACSARAST